RYSRTRSRSRTRSKQRYSRSRSRSRSRSKQRYSRSRSRSRSRSKQRYSRSRSRSRSNTRKPRPILKNVNVVTTRAQQKRFGQGQRISPSQIPRQMPQINAPIPPQMRIRTGPHGQLIGSPYSSQTSRQYSRSSSSFRTPSRSPSRNTNDPPSLSQSRQQTPI